MKKQWTTDRPKVDGYYWCKNSHGSSMIFEVIHGKIYMPYTNIGFDIESNFPEALIGHEWYGPLVQPGDNDKK